MNTGIDTIEWLFNEQLQVDDQWSEKTPQGFRWWADRNAQTIEVVGQETGVDGETGFLVSVRTELLQSLDLGEQELTLLSAVLMPFASMAGPVFERDTNTLYLCSLVRVYEDISQWMNRLISMAAVLQIGEARIIGSELASMLNAEEALSGPSGRGMRPQPDEMAEAIATLVSPLGRQPSQWLEAEFESTVEQFMNRPPALLATGGGAGFTVEFPYGDQSSLCQAMADQAHPRYGNGLLLVQTFPVRMASDLEGVNLALTLNGIELTQTPFGYGFGSYAYRDGALHFNCFLPNALYQRGLLPSLYFSCAERARQISARFTDNDWTEPSPSARRSAIGRMMDRLRGR